MPRAQLSFLAVLLFIGLLCPVLGHRCDHCPLKGRSVCGANGLAFANSCLASCQGIEVSQQTPCRGGFFAKDTIASTNSVKNVSEEVPPDEIARYAKAGYVLQGVLDPIVNGAGPELPVLTASTSGPVTARAADIISGTLRITRDGRVYGKPAVARTDSTSAASSAKKGSFNSSAMIGRRALLAAITNVDNRYQAQDTTIFPSSAIGHLIFGSATATYRCTATLIGRNTLLTAAHCVFETTKENRFYSGFQFAAARNVGVYPYGLIDFKEVFMFSAYADSPEDCDVTGVCAWDMAMISLKQDVGLSAGWLAYGAPCGVAVYPDPVRTCGYPSDKYIGTQWCNDDCVLTYASSAACSNDAATLPQCKVYLGQSGSSMFDSGTGVTMAVLSGRYEDDRSVWAVMSKDMEDQLRMWQAEVESAADGTPIATPPRPPPRPPPRSPGSAPVPGVAAPPGVAPTYQQIVAYAYVPGETSTSFLVAKQTLLANSVAALVNVTLDYVRIVSVGSTAAVSGRRMLLAQTADDLPIGMTITATTGTKSDAVVAALQAATVVKTLQAYLLAANADFTVSSVLLPSASASAQAKDTEAVAGSTIILIVVGCVVGGVVLLSIITIGVVLQRRRHDDVLPAPVRPTSPDRPDSEGFRGTSWESAARATVNKRDSLPPEVAGDAWEARSPKQVSPRRPPPQPKGSGGAGKTRKHGEVIVKWKPPTGRVLGSPPGY